MRVPHRLAEDGSLWRRGLEVRGSVERRAWPEPRRGGSSQGEPRPAESPEAGLLLQTEGLD